ncbi:FIG00729359: hypothetical protein [Polaromonas sp. CG9_12]|nr:FIG00729359: hypothetical protein [Polaromonas sp. CG9_12]
MKMKIGHIARACLLLAAAGSAMASSHREAPFITTAPKVDGTDFYMFNSYEAGKTGNVTMIANYLPLQDAYGGPNYFSLDPNALYEIHLDNNGDGKEDLTFQFQFKNELKDGVGIALDVGGKKVAIPLRQARPFINAADAPLSYTESFTLNVVRGDRRSGKREAVTMAAGGGKTFGKPIDYIGTKTFPGGSYEGYANSYIQNINIPGCATPGKVFVGQRKEAFSVNLGVIFDLVNAPASFITNEANAAAGGKFGELADKNVTSLALEVPASCLTQGNEKVIGGWTTASLRQGRLLNGATPSGLQASEKVGGAWTQVSRLGMPLVNEVVIGLKDKDKFNGSKPLNDAANFADYVTNPTLPALIETLFPSAKAPTNFPRTDLMTAFLTGLPTVNRPANITGLGVGGPLTEMLRLNTSIAAKPAAAQNSLGVAAGDNAGFPNGRRLADDVVDVSLRVAMGALCVLTGDTDALKVGCKPADAPAGGVAFVDGVRASATDFQQVFPYLNTPIPGAK